MSLVTKTAACAATLTAALAFGTPGQAETYNITFVGGHGTHLPWMKAIEDFFIPEVDKRLEEMGGEHEVAWNTAFGGTIAKIGGVMEAVKEGVADMGYVYTIFEPADLPLLQVTFMAPFGSGDPTLLSRIILEMHQELPELQEHWAAQNQVFLASVVSDTDHIWTSFPVEKLEDLRGRKIGASGSLSLWANGIGAVAVQGDFGTHYNNIKTGVYDGVIAFTTGLYPIKIHEVAPFMTKVDLGAMQIGGLTINKQLFDSMPEEVQQVFREVGEEYTARVSATMKQLAETFEQKMGEEGATITEFPAEERENWATTMPNLAKDWVQRNEERGLPARLVLDAYMDKLRGADVTLLRDWDKE